MKNHFIKSIVVITSITFLLLGLYSCSKKEAANPIVLGNEYQGGFIFYIDNTGQHGLIAHKMPTEVTSQGWGCYYTDMATTSETFGQGKNNTTLFQVIPIGTCHLLKRCSLFMITCTNKEKVDLRIIHIGLLLSILPIMHGKLILPMEHLKGDQKAILTNMPLL